MFEIVEVDFVCVKVLAWCYLHLFAFIEILFANGCNFHIEYAWSNSANTWHFLRLCLGPSLRVQGRVVLSSARRARTLRQTTSATCGPGYPMWARHSPLKRACIIYARTVTHRVMTCMAPFLLAREGCWSESLIFIMHLAARHSCAFLWAPGSTPLVRFSVSSTLDVTRNEWDLKTLKKERDKWAWTPLERCESLENL
jgi:hypothetical protein